MIPFALIVIIFSASNLDVVTLNLWPLPQEISVPMFTLILTVFIFGFLMGGVVAWLSAGKSRATARQQRYRADKAERELHTLSNSKDNEVSQNTSSTTLPATTRA